MAFGRFFYRFLIIFTHWVQTSIKQTSLQQWKHTELLASASWVLLRAGLASARAAVTVGEVALSSAKQRWFWEPGSLNLHTTKWKNWPRACPSSASALGTELAVGIRGSLRRSRQMMEKLWHQARAPYQGQRGTARARATHSEMLGRST